MMRQLKAFTQEFGKVTCPVEFRMKCTAWSGYNPQIGDTIQTESLKTSEYLISNYPDEQMTRN